MARAARRNLPSRLAWQRCKPRCLSASARNAALVGNALSVALAANEAINAEIAAVVAQGGQVAGGVKRGVERRAARTPEESKLCCASLFKVWLLWQESGRNPGGALSRLLDEIPGR